MTLSKQFMAWAIGFGKGLRRWPHSDGMPREIPHSKANRAQRNRFRTTSNASGALRYLGPKLLLSYLGAMVTVLGVVTIAVYQFFAYSLFQEADQQLVTIAEAAEHNFAAIQHNPNSAAQRLPNQIDRDGDLDLPWQDLRTADQTVEWFDANGVRLASVGRNRPNSPLQNNVQSRESDGGRSVTLPIITDHIVRGYVRVTTDTQALERHLNRLWLGLSIGSALALVIIGGTGWWLMRRSLWPIEQTMAKLQQFTADASHELRSPITAIKTAVEVIQSHPDRIHPADRRKLHIIAQATQLMQVLVEDLLVLARTDQISELRPIATVPLHELLDDLVMLVQPQANAAGLQLQAAPFEQSWVNGDTTQLRRVFLNLLDNAIQYTPPGGRIDLSLIQKETSLLQTSGNIAIVIVRDTGIGIATDQLPYIFDRFWRADESRTRRAGGTGLGLAIAQAIVAAHHGSITVTSQSKVGSCFCVKLPSVK